MVNPLKELLYRININVDFLLTDFMDDNLFKCYTEYFRCYHTLENHIFPGIYLIESVKSLCDNRDFVELAWWYHDAIYIPNSPLNEEISAHKAYFDCIQLGLSGETASIIYNMVLATKHSKVKPHTQDEKVLHDIDLAILGSEPEEYDKYTKLIRREYSFVNDKDFYQGRSQILNHFLQESGNPTDQKKTIYCTEYFSDLYENKAVKNIASEIDEIRKKTLN